MPCLIFMFDFFRDQDIYRHLDLNAFPHEFWASPRVYIMVGHHCYYYCFPKCRSYFHFHWKKKKMLLLFSLLYVCEESEQNTRDISKTAILVWLTVVKHCETVSGCCNYMFLWAEYEYHEKSSCNRNGLKPTCSGCTTATLGIWHFLAKPNLTYFSL